MRSARFAAAALAATLALQPLVASATDPDVPKQWALARIGAPMAWATSTGEGVLVGVVDSGVDLGHEDLAGRIAASTSCLGANHDPSGCTGDGQDDAGHGTHVAGIIAASNTNGVGIAGVAPGARLLVAKAIDAQSGGTIGDIDAAVKWVVDHGAKVVNLSLSEASPLLTSLLGSELRPSVDYAWSHGAVPVVAAGNQNLLGLLGSYDFRDLNALIVGATGPDDRVASYSSPLGSAKWALLAPGGTGDGTESDIYSTFWVPGRQNQYAYEAGTSMATPQVSAAVALLISRGSTPQQAVDRILATVDPVPCGGGSPTCRGRLNVAAAVGPPPVTTVPPAAVRPVAASPAGSNPVASRPAPAGTSAPSRLESNPTPSPVVPQPAVPAPATEPSPSPAPVASTFAGAGSTTAAAAVGGSGGAFPLALVLGFAGAAALLAAAGLLVRRQAARRPG